LQLIRPTSGTVEFLGKDLTQLSRQSLRQSRRQIQMVFQDPHACLNPLMTVGQSIADPLFIHQLATPDEAKSQVVQMLERVGLTPTEITTIAIQVTYQEDSSNELRSHGL
jgi:peptide/nickel transport system ATP-binding protein